jgi:hypothetical protein
MSLNLSDGMAIVGFLALIGGLAFAIGPDWAFVIGGVLLLSIGLFAAWRRSS